MELPEPLQSPRRAMFCRYPAGRQVAPYGAVPASALSTPKPGVALRLVRRMPVALGRPAPNLRSGGAESARPETLGDAAWCSQRTRPSYDRCRWVATLWKADLRAHCVSLRALPR